MLVSVVPADLFIMSVEIYCRATRRIEAELSGSSRHFVAKCDGMEKVTAPVTIQNNSSNSVLNNQHESGIWWNICTLLTHKITTHANVAFDL